MASSSGPESSSNTPPKMTQQSPFSATGQPDRQSVAKRMKLQDTLSTLLVLDPPQPVEATPMMFTLPDELQVMIYQPLLREFNRIWLRLFVASRAEKSIRWQVDTFVKHRRQSRPALLSVCKYLRSFATPMYFASNTFAMILEDWTAQKFDILRKIWGEDDVKRIRSVQYMVKIYIRYHPRNWGGREKTEDVLVAIRTDLLQNGTLVLSLHSSGTTRSRVLRRGLICHCELEKSATSLRQESKDNGRLFQMMAECEKFDKAMASVTKCPHCNLPALVDVELRHRQGLGWV
ncbi:hypothetical protein PRZ48_008237 [Zasmidium cellare]|uniref:F-box domain-containing protein n=1 Tax=Zasmidium cellare TaxID=395010 RepID=A0ABR0EFK8_ZASCE|nr:hypothetical protein PRZ48_008237 [Zasmidium cellare]